MTRTLAFAEELWPGLLDGTKTCTVRLEPKAEAGDVVHVRELGLALHVHRVRKMSLGAAAAIHHRASGSPDVATFRRRLKRYYRLREFPRKADCWVHHFEARHTPRSIRHARCRSCGSAPATLYRPGVLRCRSCSERLVRRAIT